MEYNRDDGPNGSGICTPGSGFTSLGGFGSFTETTLPRAINNAGVVVGLVREPPTIDRPFVWSAQSGILDPGTLFGGDGDVNDINEAGDIVGNSENASGRFRATR